MDITLCQADYHNPSHAQTIVRLMRHYSEDPMGGSRPLPDHVALNLVGELALRPYATSFLAFFNREPVGLINVFEGFSTFAARPLLNIHDVIVERSHRGRGIAGKMLATVEDFARQRGCCKLTLEVLAGNQPAKAVYEKSGFAPYTLSDHTGTAEFWQRVLN